MDAVYSDLAQECVRVCAPVKVWPEEETTTAKKKARSQIKTKREHEKETKMQERERERVCVEEVDEEQRKSEIAWKFVICCTDCLSNNGFAYYVSC